MTPRGVEQFVDWRLLWYVYQQLRTIQMANGYNCDAAVYLDVEEYRQSQDQFALFVMSDGWTPAEHNVGGGHGAPRVESSMEITIMASVRPKADLPQRALMALEQDVKTAISTSIATMKPSVGVVASLRWQNVDRFVAVLTPEREAGFTATCSFLYPQNSIW